MIRSAIVSALLLCCSADAADRLWVGVPDLEHEGYGSGAIAGAVRGLVEQELSRNARFAVVERARLADVLDEIAFQQSGVTRPQGAAEVGGGHNVQLLLFGEVGRLSTEAYHLSLRVVEVTSNRVLRSEEANLSREAVEATVRPVVRRLMAMALGSLPVEMVLIPAGTMAMGSERYPEEQPVHEVRVDAFRIDRTEVTAAAFAVYAETLGRPPKLDGEPDWPATDVAWKDAAGFCGWVGKRLPTEAEWEVAARGPQGRTYPWGQDPPTAARARFAGAGREPVRVWDLSDGATPEGALNMAGNVSEWVADWWSPAAYSSAVDHNPPGPAAGDYRVVRGGSFLSMADELRGAARGFHNPLRGGPSIGFRCVASAP
jgi:formylglycine-generating enzyme required for sulfatase activity